MPAKFTRAFAERLDRTTPWHVREAEPGDALSAGCVLVAPGSGSLILKREGPALKVDVLAPQPEDRYVPSVDRMLTSCAGAMGSDVCAIVLTGMGGDGGRGVKAIKAAGGRTVAEAPETAVIFGMPQEAIATGAIDEVVPLPNIPERIARFAQRK
jgi:two-component system chemotaxis response regulator CheB